MLEEERQEQKKKCKLMWTDKDWAWLCFILFGIVTFVISIRLSNNGYEIVNILSIGAAISSITLAVIAIIYSIINNNSASQSLGGISDKVGLITEMYRKVESVENIVASLNISSGYSEKIQDQAKDSIRRDSTKEESADLECEATVKHRFTRFHFKITLNVSLDVFSLGEMIDDYFQTQHHIPVEDYSINQNDLRGIIFESTTFIEGCVIVKNTLKMLMPNYFLGERLAE